MITGCSLFLAYPPYIGARRRSACFFMVGQLPKFVVVSVPWTRTRQALDFAYMSGAGSIHWPCIDMSPTCQAKTAVSIFNIFSIVDFVEVYERQMDVEPYARDSQEARSKV